MPERASIHMKADNDTNDEYIPEKKAVHQDIEISINNFDTENDFEKMHQDKIWVVGKERGKIYVEILKLCGYDLTYDSVLDIGSGYGGVSLIFSQNSAVTIGLDISEHLLQIAKKRAKISNQNNFNALFATANFIPIKDKCVDIILLIGVLEYIPLCNPSKKPLDTHLEVFGEIKRMLRKRGVFLVNIINRYWLGYWLGMKEFLTGIPYISILPRKISNFIYKIIKGKPYYLEQNYSYFELNSILIKAKFKHIKRFIGLPSCGYIETVADMDNKNDVKQKLNSLKIWKPFIPKGIIGMGFLPKIFWKIMNTLGLIKLFCSNFIYVCEVKD